MSQMTLRCGAGSARKHSNVWRSADASQGCCLTIDCEYLARLTRRISQALSEPLPKGNKVDTRLAKPYLQVNTAELTGWLDDYIWTQLFGATFNRLEGENWRVLLLQAVVDHITKVFAVALLESEQRHVTEQTELHLRYLFEVPRLMMQERHSVGVSKCIYTRLGWPARNGGLERPSSTGLKPTRG